MSHTFHIIYIIKTRFFYIFVTPPTPFQNQASEHSPPPILLCFCKPFHYTDPLSPSLSSLPLYLVSLFQLMLSTIAIFSLKKTMAIKIPQISAWMNIPMQQCLRRMQFYEVTAIFNSCCTIYDCLKLPSCVWGWLAMNEIWQTSNYEARSSDS